MRLAPSVPPSIGPTETPRREAIPGFEDLRLLKELPLEGQRVFIRADLDVRLESGGVKDDEPLRRLLPTIEFVKSAGGRVILAGQLSKPNREAAPQSFEPVAERLAELLKSDVFLPDDCVGDAARKVVQDARPGQVCLLENLGYHEGEGQNDEGFARRLLALCDVYVNEAFRESNRPGASIDALPRMVEHRGVGLAFERELRGLLPVLGRPAKPFMLIVGGARVAERFDFIEGMLERGVSDVMTGGAVGSTLLASRGVDLKATHIDKGLLARGRGLLALSRDRRIPLHLPLDVVIAKDVKAPEGRVCALSTIPAEESVLDVGPQTIAAFAERAIRAGTVLFVGPLGASDHSAFGEGTRRLAQRIAEAKVPCVVVGTSTTKAVRAAGEEVTNQIGFISAGDRASYDLIRGKRLPGLDALRGGAT